MTTIKVATAFGATTADTGNLSASELYDSLECWELQMTIRGRGRSEAAFQFKAAAKQHIRRTKQELSDRCLPMERPDWLQDAKAELFDAQDERETCALDVAVQ